MTKIKLGDLKRIIREAVRNQIDEQLAGGINVAAGGKTAPTQKKPAQPGGVQGLVQSGMTAEQLAQQAEKATDPAKKQEYMQAFSAKLQNMGLDELVGIVKGVQDPQVKQMAQQAAGVAFRKAIGVGRASAGGVPAPPAFLGK